MSDIYLSVDIEADGPIPGMNSMLSIGAVAIDINKKIHGEFEVNLKPLLDAVQDSETMDWWKKQPEAWEYCTSNQVPAKTAMLQYREFIEQLPGKVIFMGYPSTYDFMFHHWYLVRFTGKDPCGFSGMDIKSLAAGHLKIPYKQSVKRNYPKHWFENMPHDHKALTDARGQAILGINIVRAIHEDF